MIKVPYEVAANFAARCVAEAKLRGWSGSYAALHSHVGLPDEEFNYAYIYAQVDDGEKLDGFYFGCSYFDDAESIENLFRRFIDRTPSLRENKMKKLFEAVEAAKTLGEDLALPADFINPLILMADQLRTNALENKSRAAELNDEIPS
jgi:hypothetical protein